MADRRIRAGNDLAIKLANQLRLADGEPPQAKDNSTVIDEARGQLSRIDCEIVTLTACECLAPREIAAVLGLSANLVRIRLDRARNALRGYGANTVRPDRNSLFRSKPAVRSLRLVAGAEKLAPATSHAGLATSRVGDFRVSPQTPRLPPG